MSVTLQLPLASHILNGYLAENQFIQGAKVSEADQTVAKALGGKPAAEFPALAKWYGEVNKEEAAAEEDDEDVDLFGSDDEVDEAAEQLKAQRIAEYNAKKAAKPKPIAKTTVSIEVKPWDDETDLEAMTAAVKGITMDGLLWGGSQLIPIGFGIKKLLVNCVVEDDKVLLDDLTEQIEALEDFVQSVDIAAMQKI
ncbi:hypothetical protein DM01DRAFT_1386240 [Hesseltinella vesiculosa]|uniref:Elongation factor 1-beta n=1 Tax=Hesseltinella vesiculosa TaxID=101127 RepID=A0A1X2G6B8_9FUNG|nr:hypothetical protein DM01DRAFT_1386240 [Hesseltinella vesiculosa]